jgi:hypothetical protein
LGDNQATVAENCNLLGGDLRPLYADKSIQAADSDSISLYYWNEHSRWLYWDSDVDVVRGPIGEDAFDRIYVTGDGVPKVKGGTTGNEKYTLGIPKPTSTPTVSLTDRPDEPWSITWHYWYEEENGAKKDSGLLSDSDGSVNQTEFGKTYSFTEPTKTDASAEAVFIPVGKAYDENGNYLGAVVPDPSRFEPNSDLVVSGQNVTGLYESGTLTLEYNVVTDDDTFAQGTSYVYCFVSKWGEEGPPSDPSSSIAVSPVQAVKVEDIQTSLTGDYAIEKVRIYRVETAISSGTFKFVADITFGTGEYLDSLLNNQLGDTIPSTNWFPPPTDMAGIVAHPSGFVVGFSGRTVYCSDIELPHAYPIGNQYPVDYDIVGLGVSGNSIVVLTKGITYSITGTLPDSMNKVRVSGRQPCVSKRSIADNGTTVIYASADGLVAVTDYSSRLLTESLYKREQWQRDLVPGSMIGAVHDGIYYGWSGTDKSIAINFDEGRSALTTVSFSVDGVFSDLETDELYYLSDGTIYGFQQDTTRRTATWRGKEVTTGYDECFSVGRVVCDTYPVIYRVYRDGSQVASVTVKSNKAFRIPRLKRGRYWTTEVLVDGDCDSLFLGQSMREVN